MSPPTLSKGDIVVMDNLSSHKGPKVEQLIKAAAAELRYLPRYSPDMIRGSYTGYFMFYKKVSSKA